MYPEPDKLTLPVETYKLGDLYSFGKRIRRYVFLWATHLGDDVMAESGTKVHAIGDGHVVWAQMRLGSAERRDWGGVIIIGHTNPTDHSLFYSIYGHLTDLQVQEGDTVTGEQHLGTVAPATTPENGWWKNAHLHFAIYTGPWKDRILPGWARPEHRLMRGSSKQTKLAWWHSPRRFIGRYNA